MKNLLLITILFTSFTFFGQVGVGTTQPEATLHINGTLLVNTTDQSTVTTTKIAGLNAKGNVRDITIGQNLSLQNNILSATTNSFDHSFGAITLIKTNSNGGEYDNVDLQIGAGQLNQGKTIIRINVIDPTKPTDDDDAKITGFAAGYDGQHVWIYAQSGKVELEAQDTDSNAANRIQENDKKAMKKWAMIELVYDASISRWIIMNHHG